MQSTRLTSKGQIVIPKKIRSRHNWHPGQELSVIDTGDGILLKPAPTFKKTTLDQVAGILKYSRKPITLEEMEEAIKQGALERKE